MPGYGKTLENGDFNSDLTKALTGSNLHQRDRHKMKKVMSPETVKCLNFRSHSFYMPE